MLNVQRTIKQFIAAGAKGCTLEDQKWPKKSGSVRGKEVIGMDEHIAKVQSTTLCCFGAWNLNPRSLCANCTIQQRVNLFPGCCCQGGNR